MVEIAHTVDAWMIAAAAYPVFQTLALARLRGPLRSISVILMVVMVAVAGVSASAYYLEPSNMWQIILMLALPPAVVLVAGLLALGLVVQRPATA